MHSRPGRHSIASEAAPRTGEHGYAMAALLVGMGVMAVMMSVAMPVWSTQAKRAREDELVFRGEQYARAIGLFQRKYANALPPSVDVLVNERFLRKKYLDPITGGEFQALTGAAGQAAPGPAGPGRTGGAGGTGARGTQTGGSTFGSAQTAFNSALAQQGRGGMGTGAIGGGAGGIVGVASKSTERSLRLYNGRGAYNEWTFIPVQRQVQAGEGAGPGAQAPGRGGQQGRGRGGERGTGSGSRTGGTGSESFRPPGGGGGFRPPAPGR